MRAVAEILKTAQPCTIDGTARGTLELVPGTIWSGNKMLISASESAVVATEDDRVYEWNTGLFIRDEWMGCLEQAGKSALGWVVIAKFEMALLTAVIAPLWMVLAMPAAKAGLFYARNQEACSVAMANALPALKLFDKWRNKYPTFWRKLKSKVGRTIWNEFKHENVRLITAEDAASFIAGILKGLDGPPQVTLGIVLRIITSKSFFGGLILGVKVLGLRAGPSAVTRPIHEAAEELSAYLNSIGYQVSLQEARQILHEFAQDPAAGHDMQRMEVYLRALLPSLDTLYAAYQRGV